MYLTHLVTVRSTHPLKINTIESTTNHACHHIPPPPPPPIPRPPRTSTLRRPSAPPSVTAMLSLPSPVMANRRGNRGPAARLVGAGVGQAGLGTSARANTEHRWSTKQWMRWTSQTNTTIAIPPVGLSAPATVNDQPPSQQQHAQWKSRNPYHHKIPINIKLRSATAPANKKPEARDLPFLRASATANVWRTPLTKTTKHEAH
ncbi:hypothetical protein CKAH01_17434 [Colletotrichum kahawae]|uniref:Uncharacterized protein n=1 Tax=Colletotrichum kahawae TaxID=34407 RepID=A0AAD9YC14_COLKA|nr:hypothetical protein CKAH01_17434 [Colletotrichum kahawae]